MKFVDVNRLQVGMILGEDIYRHDELVIAEGVELTAKLILLINRISLDEVKIKFTLESSKVKTNKTIDERYIDSVKKFKEICFSIAIDNVYIYDKVKDALDPLFDEIGKSTVLVSKIWQLEMADYYTYEHSVKVSMLAMLLAKWLNKSNDFVYEIGKAGLLHDIGKCNIPNEILNKPDRLTKEEFDIIKTHSTLGYLILNNTKELSKTILKGVLHHHEKYDGTGYPAKLSGKDIPEYSRIISIVDVFDAMTSDRVYKNKMNPYKVIEIIHSGNDGALDLEILEIFISNIKDFFVGSKVLMSNGSIGTVVSTNTKCSYKPIVKIGAKEFDLSINDNIEIKEIILDK